MSDIEDAAADRFDGLAGDFAALGRVSTAKLVADVLRRRVAEGYFPPGTRLPEDAIGGALGVSRNTLREAFRILTHERLLVHELNRGVFVRLLTVEEVVELYHVRRIIECAVAREVTSPPPDLDALRLEVRAGRAAARRRDWQALGTANIRFHQELTALAGSTRINEIMGGLLAELRLVFHVMADPRRFHEPYLVRNVEIMRALEGGDGPGAESLLGPYLDDALAQLVQAYDERARTNRDRTS